jgi:hypothetical protein
MTSEEETLSKELVEEELQTLVRFIENHVHWAKSHDNEGLARLNMVTAESLIESANLVRSLCERLSGE